MSEKIKCPNCGCLICNERVEPSDTKKMPPFRAWVAWHPENELREKLSVYREKDECTRFIGYLRNNDIVPSHKSGWRIVEVEVRAVEAEK